jgi:hypothetical protein
MVFELANVISPSIRLMRVYLKEPNRAHVYQGKGCMITKLLPSPTPIGLGFI